MIPKRVQAPHRIERCMKMGKLPYGLVVDSKVKGGRFQLVVPVYGEDAEKKRVNGGHCE